MILDFFLSSLKLLLRGQNSSTAFSFILIKFPFIVHFALTKLHATRIPAHVKALTFLYYFSSLLQFKTSTELNSIRHI